LIRKHKIAEMTQSHRLENTLDSVTVKEVAGILRCSKTHALNVIEGRVRGLPKLPHLTFGRRKVVRKEWLAAWMEEKDPIALGQLGVDDMNAIHSSVATARAPGGRAETQAEERPLTVRQAAHYLGVSAQTVYLWVERKQIPHLRVMGRNIRFLKSELEPFRAQFKQEVVNWQDQ
jgi:excisionase family DNA binding protein